MEIGFEGAIARAARRFEKAAGSRGTYHYVLGKLRSDPSTRAIAARGPLGDVLDLGCGRGQLAVALLEVGARRVVGYDWDAEKIALAERAAEGFDARFFARDLRDLGEIEPADTVLLVDVLHYFEPRVQDALLARAADLVRPGGRLFVRDGASGYGWRTGFTWAAEWIGTKMRVNRGERVVLRDVSRELVPVLEAKGMTCAVEPCWSGTPCSNVLLEARAQ